MIKPQNIIAQISKNLKTKKWTCLAPECNEVAINSHLIQQNGLLSNITEKGHLVELRMRDAYKWNEKEPPIIFERVGISNALSHPVFCKKHDTEIFKSIEQSNMEFDTYESFLLFSYRAVCAEIRKKQINIEQYTRIINAKTLDGILNKENLHLMVRGSELGIKDLEILKKELEDEIEAHSDKYNFFAFTYPKFDLYASAAFSATDVHPNRKEEEFDLENIYIHILPLQNESLILVGYHEQYKSPNTEKYCRAWEGLSQQDLEIKLTNLFATNIENWGLSPMKFGNLKEGNKRKYIQILTENTNYFGVDKNYNFNLFKQ